MRITVCKNCKKRFPACHDSCADYKAQKQTELDAWTADRRSRVGDYQLHQMYSERMLKGKKRKK